MIYGTANGSSVDKKIIESAMNYSFSLFKLNLPLNQHDIRIEAQLRNIDPEIFARACYNAYQHLENFKLPTPGFSENSLEKLKSILQRIESTVPSPTLPQITSSIRRAPLLPSLAETGLLNPEVYQGFTHQNYSENLNQHGVKRKYDEISSNTNTTIPPSLTESSTSARSTSLQDNTKRLTSKIKRTAYLRAFKGQEVDEKYQSQLLEQYTKQYGSKAPELLQVYMQKYKETFESYKDDDSVIHAALYHASKDVMNAVFRTEEDLLKMAEKHGNKSEVFISSYKSKFSEFLDKALARVLPHSEHDSFELRKRKYAVTLTATDSAKRTANRPLNTQILIRNSKNYEDLAELYFTRYMEVRNAAREKQKLSIDVVRVPDFSSQKDAHVRPPRLR
jgi:hypothetical protein